MSSLYDFLHSEESRRGAVKAGWLGSFLFLLLALWALAAGAGWGLVLIAFALSVSEAGINLAGGTLFKLPSLGPWPVVVLQLFMTALWSFLLPGLDGLPLTALYVLILYGSSLYLKIYPVLFTAAASIVLMNLSYLHDLNFFHSPSGISLNPLEWTGFAGQIFSTLILLFFASAFPGRQRIIRRLIRQQQTYFDMVRDKNSSLSDSLDLFIKGFGLSIREGEVLGVLILGRTYRMIAGELFISLDTVKSHVKSIYRKCGVGSREELLETLRETALAGHPESD